MWFVVYRLLFNSVCLRCVVLLFDVCCLLFGRCSLVLGLLSLLVGLWTLVSVVVMCSMFVVCRPLSAVRCPLCVVCRLLFVD